MLPAFFVENQAALLFYTSLIVVIILFRKKVTWQTFGIGLYKTKIGLNLMRRLGKKHEGIVQLLGMIGIGVGFLGQLLILWMLGKGFFALFTNPTAPPVVSPVIPGFNIWGHDIKVPLITGWLALFVVIVIHEFSHGVVSIAHKIRVKSSGLLVFGPIAGAFVEPDENRLVKERPDVQYALFAAGPWSNILSAGIFVLFGTYLLTPLVLGMTLPGGVEIVNVMDGYPARGVLSPGMLITSVDGVSVMTLEELGDVLRKTAPGDTIIVGTDQGDYPLTLAQNPDAPEKGYMGVTLQTRRNPLNPALWYRVLLRVLSWLREFMNWIVLLSLGIGLANLLPIGPVDGGRMLQTAARQVLGDDARGDWWWKRISLAVLSLLVALMLVPILRNVF